MIYYTWHDIERAFKFEFKDKWHKCWNEIDVYDDEIVISVQPNSIEIYKSDFSSLLKEFFGGRFSIENNEIDLDYKNNKLRISYEENEEEYGEPIPLFKAQNRTYKEDSKIEILKGKPVIAFHSYKGGTGRTLSLLSTVFSSSSLKNKDKPYKLLIVDGDLEAPGLTWLAAEQNICDFSFLDALSIIHGEENWREAMPFIAKRLNTSIIEIPTGEQISEHYFLPAYREPYQLIDMPVTPQLAVQMIDRQWIIGDFLSELGASVGADLVLVDLRAGVSEYSAPLLFDNRIQKVFVTATSMQSKKGLNSILKEVYKTPLTSEQLLPNIFVTMIPPDWAEDKDFEKIKKEQIKEDILKDVNILDDKAIENDLEIPFRFFDFAQQLIHLDGFESTNKKLIGTQMSKEVNKFVEDIYFQGQYVVDANAGEVISIKEEQKETFLQSLLKIASEREYAEQSTVYKFLVTSSFKNIIQKFKYDIPLAVILGTKGSGKTFMYNQLLNSLTWQDFRNKVEVNSDSKNTIVVPFLFSKNNLSSTDFINSLNKNIDYANENLGFKIKLENIVTATSQIPSYENTTQIDWKNIWKKELFKIIGMDFNSFDELSNYLEKMNKKVVFIVDGIEDIFQNTQENTSQKMATRVLIQDIMNELRTFSKSRIGLIVFSRLDIAENAIEQNWGQFKSQYESYELKWNRSEALRLILWLAKEANFESKVNDIEKASEEILIEALYPLWGVKLGSNQSNNAKSADWVLAALSDLKGRLQARDIVRFLIETTRGSLKSKDAYTDRYLTPTAIRNSIEPCSTEKIKEIEKEMISVKLIFDKFRRTSIDKRFLPLKVTSYKLNNSEIEFLIQQGFLIKLDDGYYMPEIIRYGLEFSYKARGRSKVLSMLKKANSSVY